MSQTMRSTYGDERGTRAFVLFTPSHMPAAVEDRALVVMLHGCTQTADDMAAGTRMNAAGEAGRFLVLYPEQSATAHAQNCWNWYAPQQYQRGMGEAALLAGLIDSVARAEGVNASRVSLVGISAGGAMAANLMVAYPERYAALAVHSGVPALAAADVVSALGAMRQGAADGNALGARALAAMGSRARAVSVIVLHGADDKVVSPANLQATVQQWNVVNAGAAPVESVLLEGVGHGWSGGSAEGTYTAPNGPDATTHIVTFFRRVGAIPPA